MEYAEKQPSAAIVTAIAIPGAAAAAVAIVVAVVVLVGNGNAASGLVPSSRGATRSQIPTAFAQAAQSGSRAQSAA